METTKLFMILFAVIMIFFAINAMASDWTENDSFSYQMEHSADLMECAVK